jgi:hypothetical protein
MVPTRPLRPEHREEAVRIREAVLNATKLATHLRPDLDALLSIWICQRIRSAFGSRPIPVLFIPANVEGVEEGILAVDIGSGRGLEPFGEGLAIKRSALKGSACMALYRALPDFEKDILEAETTAISTSDEKGENVHSRALRQTQVWSDVKIRNQLLTTNIWTVIRRLRYTYSDQKLLEWAMAHFDGAMIEGTRKAEGEKAASRAIYIGPLALLPHNAPPESTKFAFQRGAEVVFFSSSLGGDRWTLGLARNPKAMSPRSDLRQLGLEEILPGIRVHQDGFAAGWVAKGPLTCLKSEFDRKRELLHRHLIKHMTEGEVESYTQ